MQWTLVIALMWIVATVRGVRRMDAQQEYRRRVDALRRVVEQ
jgi:hypothetical protein